MPKRRYPPVSVRRAVREKQNGKCGCREKCGAILPEDGKFMVQYQHDPALELREVNADDTDWIPAQHDPRYLFAELTDCHKRETYHPRSKATSLGSDRHAIDKTKRILGLTCNGPKKKIPPRPFQKRPEGHEYKWGKQSFRTTPTQRD